MNLPSRTGYLLGKQFAYFFTFFSYFIVIVYIVFSLFFSLLFRIFAFFDFSLVKCFYAPHVPKKKVCKALLSYTYIYTHAHTPTRVHTRGFLACLSLPSCLSLFLMLHLPQLMNAKCNYSTCMCTPYTSHPLQFLHNYAMQ